MGQRICRWYRYWEYQGRLWWNIILIRRRSELSVKNGMLWWHIILFAPSSEDDLWGLRQLEKLNACLLATHQLVNKKLFKGKLCLPTRVFLEKHLTIKTANLRRAEEQFQSEFNLSYTTIIFYFGVSALKFIATSSYNIQFINGFQNQWTRKLFQLNHYQSSL